MAHKLFLKPLSPQEIGEEYLFDWALYDYTGQRLANETTKGLSSITQVLMQSGVQSADVVVFWPAISAFAGHVNLPSAQARYVQQALPFAVEEMLAQDLDSVHLAHGDKTKNGSYPVIGVDKPAFAALFDLFDDEELLELKQIILDADSLALGGYDLCLALSHDAVLLKSAGHQMIGLESRNLIPYLDSLLSKKSDEEVEEQDKLWRVKLFVADGAEEQVRMTIAQLQQYSQFDLDIENASLTQFELLCESYVHQASHRINLCQGAFKRVSVQNAQWKRWQGVAALLLIGFAMQLSVFVGKGYVLNQEASEISEAAVAEYKKLVPGKASMSPDKLARVIKGKLNQAKQAGGAEIGFLDLLGEAGYQYQQSPAKSQFSFKSLNYNAQRGELVIELHAKTFEQLNSFKQAIVDAGLEAKIGSSVQENDYFRGRISVSGS